MRAERGLIVLGALCCAGALGLALVDPRAALTGWLAAAVAFAAIPAGALCLQAMMRLIPGAWGEALRLMCEGGAMLAVPAAVAFVPVLLGMTAIYPWMVEPPHNRFQAAWLAPLPFALRTLLWFGLLIGSARLLRARTSTAPVAAVTLLLWPVLGSAVATDWLMSLRPHFASSGFGLQILILSVTLAYAVLLLLRLRARRTPVRPGVLGALLLTLLLLWAYIQFLPFFILWSPGLPEGAAWYGERSGGWDVAEIAFGTLGGVPLLMLLFPAIRHSPAWLARLAIAVIAGKLIEFAWFALPGTGLLGVGAYALAMLAGALLTAALLPAALRRRIAARRPKSTA